MKSLYFPTDAPFSLEQEAWLLGFLAGVAAAESTFASETDTTPTLVLDIFFGSQTGNSEGLAYDLADAAGARGLGATVTSLDSVQLSDLAAKENIVVITSTYGEGDMPDNAKLLWEELISDNAQRLEEHRFAVLALGDSSYDNFCEAGKLFDLRLEQLGAQRLVPRVDCDVDFEEASAAWIESVVDSFAVIAPSGQGAPAGGVALPEVQASKRPQWSRKNPFPSSLVDNRVLSGQGSAKEIHHFEFALEDSGIEYAAGDALAVMPRNNPALVSQLVQRCGWSGDDIVDGRAIGELLETSYEIQAPPKQLLDYIADKFPGSEVAALVNDEAKQDLASWLWGKDLLDVLRLMPQCELTPEEFISLLRPLTARSYSISSSPLHSPDRINLTVAAVRYGNQDRHYGGVCSTFMADRLGEGKAGIYLQPNASFRVPADDDTPMIMVGPGTGVAPFRAFLQEREARGAQGRNWLFFGDQHQSTDFIYADEIAHFQEIGVLNRLDLAFSRDQAEKIYVQTRMRARAAELYAWLEDGAHFYICGDASRMAKDVDDALHAIVAEQRGVGADEADEYVTDMIRAKRYVRDVY